MGLHQNVTVALKVKTINKSSTYIEKQLVDASISA